MNEQPKPDDGSDEQEIWRLLWEDEDGRDADLDDDLDDDER